MQAASSYFDGFCDFTSKPTLKEDSCAHAGAKGSWPLEVFSAAPFSSSGFRPITLPEAERKRAWSAATRQCWRRCTRCTRCAGISVSVPWSDCSWFTETLGCEAKAKAGLLYQSPSEFRTFLRRELPHDGDLNFSMVQPQQVESNWPLCSWVGAHVGAHASWQMCVHRPGRDIGISDGIRKDGCFECGMVKRVLRAMSRHARRHEGGRRGGHEPLLVDIGGNIGMYTLAAAAAGFRVETFEPVPESALMITHSLARNGLQSLVRLHTMALSDRMQPLAMGVDNFNQGGVKHVAAARGAATGGGVRLPAVRLDAVLAPPPAGTPVYLKLDIEGGECAASTGMREYVRNTTIIGVSMEFWQARQGCCTRWLRAGEFFDVLRARHGLCPWTVPYPSKLEESNGHQVAEPLSESLCGHGHANIEWRPCSGGRGEKGRGWAV
jgi:FkbM family methyltransferase